MDFTSPKIMGIVNVTDDSFSGDGLLGRTQDTGHRIQQMIAEGADIIDIGGESTGPDSKDVSAEEELARVKPVIDWIAQQTLTEKTLFSIDTYKAPVAEYALAHGFGMVNDVTALRGDPAMMDVLLQHEPYVVLMYSKDPTARTTRSARQYTDVMDTVKQFLLERVKFLRKAGYPPDKIILDPGMGMFVSADPKYSFEIIDRLDELTLFNHPVCVGVSRKSFLGGALKDRVPASLEWSLKAIQNGASIVRVHDVAGMRGALLKASLIF